MSVDDAAASMGVDGVRASGASWWRVVVAPAVRWGYRRTCFRKRRRRGLRLAVVKTADHHVMRDLDAALSLMDAHAPSLSRQLPRLFAGGVWVREMYNLGAFVPRGKRCELGLSLFSAPHTPADIAVTLVHEAVHAKIERFGIAYDEHRRAAIEAVCIRREIAFAMRLPDGDAIAMQSQHRLATLDPRHFSDAAFARVREIERRERVGAVRRALRDINREGMPARAILAVTRLRKRWRTPTARR